MNYSKPFEILLKFRKRIRFRQSKVSPNHHSSHEFLQMVQL
jgi:hypothetical protein